MINSGDDMSDAFDMQGHKPLAEYPWNTDVERLFASSIGKNKQIYPFLFDCVMSLAYIDSTAGLEKSIEYCANVPSGFNAHMSFINLCSSCHDQGVWQYQKAAKPQSGALGKLSSEVVLKFVEHLSTDIEKVIVLGGSGYADAVIRHRSGITILAEVKAAPLITYPLLLSVLSLKQNQQHSKAILTASQLKSCQSAIDMHGVVIPLGLVGSQNWPFKAFVDFVEDDDNSKLLNKCFLNWQEARRAYVNKDKTNPFYYLTNACGNPPIEAKRVYGWPSNEVISDGKTSVGMDRTDDIKKAVYQTLKIGITHQYQRHYTTAIVSNLPAYRHGLDYVDPVLTVLWGNEVDIQEIAGVSGISREKLHYVFDYIITLSDPVLRELVL